MHNNSLTVKLKLQILTPFSLDGTLQPKNRILRLCKRQPVSCLLHTLSWTLCRCRHPGLLKHAKRCIIAIETSQFTADFCLHSDVNLARNFSCWCKSFKNLARFLQDMTFLSDSCKICLFARMLQDLHFSWLSCKILARYVFFLDQGPLWSVAETCKILHDLVLFLSETETTFFFHAF